MSKEPYETPRKARDPNDLERHILDSTIAKTDAEWWAKRRIEELERERDSAYKIADHYRSERDALQAEIAELVMAISQAHIIGGQNLIDKALAKVRKPE